LNTKLSRDKKNIPNNTWTTIAGFKPVEVEAIHNKLAELFFVPVGTLSQPVEVEAMHNKLAWAMFVPVGTLSRLKEVANSAFELFSS